MFIVSDVPDQPHPQMETSDRQLEKYSRRAAISTDLRPASAGASTIKPKQTCGARYTLAAYCSDHFPLSSRTKPERVRSC